MELVALYEKQVALDDLVQKRLQETDPAFKMHDIAVVDKRIFAFKVELAELANEVGFFKYWKKSHQMDRNKTLEEWADCLHFLLSIGISRGYDVYVSSCESSVKPIEHLETATFLFYSLISMDIKNHVNFAVAMNLLITIGHTLGFDEEQLVDAYERKNLKNIERQLGGY